MMPGPVDDLDHGSYSVAYGTKIGIDATRKDASEGYTREWPPDMIMDAGDARARERTLARLRARRRSQRALVAGRLVGTGTGRLRRADDREARRASFCARFASSTRCSRCPLPTSARYWPRAAFRRWPRSGGSRWPSLGARTAAMAANRFLDREIDARNPRTARRALSRAARSPPAAMLWATAAGLAVLLWAALDAQSAVRRS